MSPGSAADVMCQGFNFCEALKTEKFNARLLPVLWRVGGGGGGDWILSRRLEPSITGCNGVFSKTGHFGMSEFSIICMYITKTCPCNIQ